MYFEGYDLRIMVLSRLFDLIMMIASLRGTSLK